MVGPVSSSVSSYTTSQPSVTQQPAETRVNTQQVQPRQAPAADTQRSDQRFGRDERNEAADARENRVNASAGRAAEATETRRGSTLDVVA